MSTVIHYHAFGGPEVLEVADESTPPPGPGEVTVESRAIGVNPVDWKIIEGRYATTTPDFPLVPGNEASGIVIAVGADAGGFAIGDEVLWRSGGGGNYRAIGNRPVDALLRKPSDLAFEQAASIPVAGGTAYSAVEQLGIGPDDVLLVHAAAGGVGSAAAQIARARGARVIGTASAANHDHLRSLGVEPVEYGDGLVDRVRALGGITASIDTVGGAESVAATIALLGGPERSVTVARDENSQSAGIPVVEKPDDANERALEHAARGELVLEIATLPLSEARRALELSRAGHVRGKLVLIP